MKILALEFSTSRRSVVAWSSTWQSPGQVVGGAVQESGLHTHTFALVEEALKQAGWGLEQVEAFAVGLGPGSYTGIRVALAAVQGWSLAQPVPVAGISSVECLAEELVQRGWTGPHHILLDAQRGELYHAAYHVRLGAATLSVPLRIVSVEQLKEEIPSGEWIVGPEAQRWFPEARVLHPGAETLARLVSIRKEFAPAETLEPVYLRTTQFVKAPPTKQY